MASATPKTELDEINQLEQRIAVVRKEIQILTAEGLTTGAVLPVLKRKRKEKLQAELRNLLQKLRLLKQNLLQPKPPVSLPIPPKIDEPPPPPSISPPPPPPSLPPPPPPPPPPTPPPARLNTKDFLSKELISADERQYYDKCKEYYRITNKPLISVANEVLENGIELKSSILKLGIDEDYDQFDLQKYLDIFCPKVNINKDDFVILRTQKSSVILTVEIFGKTAPADRKEGLKLIYTSCTDELQNELAKIKTFFIFLGPENALLKMQKHQAQIMLNPQFNRVYARGSNFWLGAIEDGKDRGNQPYYCPVGWKRWSFYVCDNFDKKFSGWCICYHGTKFAYGLSILLNGMKPAEIKALGDGIYTTPSINYASHPRYAEVMPIPASARNIFKSGEYIQYVLECRIHPDSIKKIGCETLRGETTRIDSNIMNEAIEWVIDNKNQSIVDFNDPKSPIVCTGLMIRVTDDHPGLLPESEWWYQSHLCERKTCCYIGIDRSLLEKKRQSGLKCNIIYD